MQLLPWQSGFNFTSTSSIVSSQIPTENFDPFQYEFVSFFGVVAIVAAAVLVPVMVFSL